MGPHDLFQGYFTFTITVKKNGNDMLFSPKNTVIKSRIFSQDAPSIADCQMG
jgi:hypothetical protein